jgi:hypothetical protein
MINACAFQIVNTVKEHQGRITHALMMNFFRSSASCLFFFGEYEEICLQKPSYLLPGYVGVTLYLAYSLLKPHCAWEFNQVCGYFPQSALLLIPSISA